MKRSALLLLVLLFTSCAKNGTDDVKTATREPDETSLTPTTAAKAGVTLDDVKAAMIAGGIKFCPPVWGEAPNRSDDHLGPNILGYDHSGWSIEKCTTGSAGYPLNATAVSAASMIDGPAAISGGWLAAWSVDLVVVSLGQAPPDVEARVAAVMTKLGGKQIAHA